MSDLSDYDDDNGGLDSPHSSNTPGGSEDPKKHARAQHNALERRRRDNIKDMYSLLRDSVPDSNNDRASRAAILKKAIDAIEEKTAAHNKAKEEADALEAENKQLQAEIERLRERSRIEMAENRGYIETSPAPPNRNWNGNT